MKSNSQVIIKERNYTTKQIIAILQIKTKYYNTKIPKLIDNLTHHHQLQTTHLLVQHIHYKDYLNIQHI